MRRLRAVPHTPSCTIDPHLAVWLHVAADETSGTLLAYSARAAQCVRPDGSSALNSKRLRLDVASAIGVPVAIGLILLGQVLEGGSIRSILQPTAALIVFGGTLGAVLISFSAVDILRAGSAMRTVLLWDGEQPTDTIATILEHLHSARAKGLLALEDDLPMIADPFLRKALGLIIDGRSGHDVREMLETENHNREEYDEIPAKVYEAAAGYAPTIGILGAVLGLIHTMQNLSDPSKLGGGIAVAFVATIYGVGAANLLFLPIATKIKMKARHSARRHALMVEGVLAIRDGLNPTMAEEKLLGFASQSIPTFDPGPRGASASSRAAEAA
jgi:chemotaxis protein MotA